MPAPALRPAPPGPATPVRCTFAVPDPDALRRHLAPSDGAGRDAPGPGAVRWGVPIVESRTETYLDTPERVVHRAGYFLVLRNGAERGELRLEPLRRGPARALPGACAPVPPHGPAAAPPVDDGSARASAALADRLTALAGPAPLRRLLAVHVRIETRLVEDDDGPAGLVSLVEATPADAPMGVPPYRVTRLVAESRRASPALVAWVGSLRAAVALRDDPRTLYEAVVEASGLGDPEPPDLGPADPAASRGARARAFAVLRFHFARLLAAEPAARLGEDPEAVKRMRVAIARIRTALRLWEHVLPDRILRGEKGLRRITRRLGRVRDLDLQREAFVERAGPLVRASARPDAATDAGWAGATAESLAGRRAAARAELLAEMDSPRTRRLLRRFARALRAGPGPGRSPGDALAAAAPGLLALMDRLRRDGDGLGPDSPAAAWHRLRRHGKRLRYALEFHADLLGDAGRDVVRALVALQNRLGEHQDAEVSLDRLRALREDRTHGGPAAGNGLLDAWAADEMQRAEELREGFSRTWSTLRGRRWKRLRRTLRRA